MESVKLKLHWEQICESSAITPRTAQLSFLFDHKMYVLGGQDYESFRNDLHVFDFTTQQWTEVHATGVLPEPRMAHAGCLIEDKLYVHGGFQGTRVLNDTHVLHLQGEGETRDAEGGRGRSTATTTPTAPHWSRVVITNGEPPKRQYHTCHRYGSNLILFGGGDGKEWTNQVLALDVGAGEWKEVVVKGGQAPPQGRLQHSSVLSGCELIVFGGEPNNTEQFNDLHIFNLEVQCWTTPVLKGPPPCPRVAASAVLIDGNQIYFFAGFDGTNWLNDMYILDLKAWEWCTPEVEGTRPGVRVRQSALLYDRCMYIFGGNGRHSAYNDLWKLPIPSEPTSRVTV